MKILALVFVGGGLGSVLRYLTSFYTTKLLTVGVFPLGTFIVNMIGCLLIGIFSAHFIKEPSDWKYLLVAGFCGGYTTFSTLSLESYQLYQQNNYLTLVLYLLLSFILGIFLVFIGHNCIKS